RYVGNLLDLVNEILRHGAGQGIAAHQHNDFFRVLREVDCGLSGGVGATNNIEGLAFTGERVGCPAAVVNACPLQAVDAGDVEAPPLHASSDQQRMTRNLNAVRELDVAVWSFNTNADGFLRREDFYAEALGLDHGAAREIGAAQSGGKTEVVFDARAQAGLSAGSFALNHHCTQTF